MSDAGDVVKQVTFRRTAYLNECNQILRENLKIITTEKEVVKETIGARVEGRQTLPDKRVMKCIM